MKDGRIRLAGTDDATHERECMPPQNHNGLAGRRLAVIGHLMQQRNPESLEAVSKAFNIPVNVAGSITVLLQNLFHSQACLNPKAFEPTINELVQYGIHAFELSWCYFKLLVDSSNRVAFLNTLQHLISRVDRPKHALRILLSDFCRDPEHVVASDRDAIMLANILLRTYNKELYVDIEMTPEEVLNVRNGLDQDVVHYVQFRIDSVEPRFSDKVQSVHTQLVAAIRSDQPAACFHRLLYLQREIFIFLSLLSGSVAHRLLTSALTEYGDPQSRIYRRTAGGPMVSDFLQQLKILIRGVGRVGSEDDVALLRKIAGYCPELAELGGMQENRRSVVRINEWIENIIRSFSTSDCQAASQQGLSR